jgi:hypothetical protein
MTFKMNIDVCKALLMKKNKRASEELYAWCTEKSAVHDAQIKREPVSLFYPCCALSLGERREASGSRGCRWPLRLIPRNFLESGLPRQGPDSETWMITLPSCSCSRLQVTWWCTGQVSDYKTVTWYTGSRQTRCLSTERRQHWIWAEWTTGQNLA